ncbi:hypothetical protein D3C72_1266990 [compost metagenome]
MTRGKRAGAAGGGVFGAVAVFEVFAAIAAFAALAAFGAFAVFGEFAALGAAGAVGAAAAAGRFRPGQAMADSASVSAPSISQVPSAPTCQAIKPRQASPVSAIPAPTPA